MAQFKFFLQVLLHYAWILKCGHHVALGGLASVSSVIETDSEVISEAIYEVLPEHK